MAIIRKRVHATRYVCRVVRVLTRVRTAQRAKFRLVSDQCRNLVQVSQLENIERELQQVRR